ncbi:hypothetical protein DRQ36_01880 [bacterium]|nr:MAG: hypothetical protein DRQ36_01880 [bacterium]
MKYTAFTLPIFIAIIFISSLSAQNPGCRAGFDGTYPWTIAPGMLPVHLLYDTLASYFSYFRVDSPTSEIHFDSVDVYFVPPRLEVFSYSDSLIREFRKFVYNGGILFMWGENCGFDAGSFGIIYDSLDGWFLGIEPRTTTVYDTINCIIGGSAYFIYSFGDHPVVPVITDTVFGSLGSSVYISPPSVVLARSYPTGYSLLCSDTTVDEIQPAVLGLSHYGSGTIIFHTDFTAWHHAWSGFPANNNLQLLKWLTTCSLFPHFTHLPAPGDTFVCFDDTAFIQTDIFNFGQIEPESLKIWWEGSVYDISSPQLELVGDTTFVFAIPPYSYSDGDTVFLCIETVIDTSGFWHYDSICWEYYVSIDEYPPELSAFQPAHGETLVMLDTISLIAVDTSGIDTSSISFIFLDSTIVWGDSSIWINGDTIFFDPVSAGLDPGMVDTNVHVCVHISDDNKDCTPTTIDTCWCFFLDADAIAETELPGEFEIRVYPNPFNSSCKIIGPQDWRIEIRDLSGRLIRNLDLPVNWDGKDNKGNQVASGIYFIIPTGFQNKRIKIVLIR